MEKIIQISIMQPTYLPWIGYFDLMDRSDEFVFYDDVQFVERSWHHKNKLKQSGGELLVTVPVLHKGRPAQYINQARIDNLQHWNKKHFKSIERNYFKAAYYSEYIDEIKNIYQSKPESLIDLNLSIIKFLKNKLGITTPTSLSSDLGIPHMEKSEDRVVNICKYYNAEIVYQGITGRGFADLGPFDQAGIKVVFHEYKHPVYKQQFGDFVPFLSALDLLLNEGPERSLEIIRAGRIVHPEL